MTEEALVLDNLDEEEAYLFAILSDMSGLDQAEFLWVDYSSEDNLFCPECGVDGNGAHLKEHPDIPKEDWEQRYPAPSVCFRAWAFQWPWWRTSLSLQIDQCARSVGKSLSIKVRGCAFPFLHAGQEMIITAPELVHLEPIVSLIESQFTTTRTLREMLPRGRSAVTHRPFQLNFLNGARIIGRIPQRDGKGVKGIHPIWLEMDESLKAGTLVLTHQGLKPIETVAVGDRVLTHLNRWQPVTKVIEREPQETWQVDGYGGTLETTANHPIWARRMRGTRPRSGFTAPGWWPAQELTLERSWWALPGIVPPDRDHEVPTFGLSDDVQYSGLWLLGRYLADGVIIEKKDKIVQFALEVASSKVNIVEKHVQRITSHYSIHDRGVRQARSVRISHSQMAALLAADCGRHADAKRVPPWVLSAPLAVRQAVFDGYCAGDGYFFNHDPGTRSDEVTFGSVSRELALGMTMLARGLGWSCGVRTVHEDPKAIQGYDVIPKPYYRVDARHLPSGAGRRAYYEDGSWFAAVYDSHGTGVIEPHYDLSVAEDHSFVADGVVVHNSQDYPHAGWVELNETLKRGWSGAMWRAHGVTRGVRDDFYEYTQDSPDNPWKVHRFAAMWRPNWTDQERAEAILKYGSREDPDYRRNVLGLHGDKTNPIFVLTQLMRNVDNDSLSAYNTDEYMKYMVKAEQLELFEQEINEVLDFPPAHLSYAGKTPAERLENPKAHYWVGMDVGFTIDPSEILVFVEHRRKSTDPQTVLKLLTRISMTRMPHRQQIMAILQVIDFYRPRAFAMDKGGNGLPLFQELTEHIDAFRDRQLDKVPLWMQAYDLESALTTIKGYNFSEKLLVELDPTVEVSPYADQDEIVQKTGMKRNAKEYATDVLREMVDRQQLWLPWDDDLLKQFQGGTWTSNKSMDAYGRRIFSRGNDHVLDAARQMALAWAQHEIEEVTKKRPAEPVFDAFVAM